MIKRYFSNIGHTYEDEKVFLFFGNALVNFEQIKNTFSQFNFTWLNQIHSDYFVFTTSPAEKEISADGHYTDVKNLALGIITADCLPIFYYTKNYVAALHCGWRGIQQNLITKSFSKIKEASIKSFIGPHISVDNFEVDNDVQQLLLKSASGLNIDTVVKPHKLKEKSYINLSAIAEKQLNGTNCQSLKINTFSNNQYHSYRRDGQSAGRNYSFIVLK